MSLTFLFAAGGGGTRGPTCGSRRGGCGSRWNTAGPGGRSHLPSCSRQGHRLWLLCLPGRVALGIGGGWGSIDLAQGPLTTHLSFQAEDDADDDFSPWQEGTSPTLVSVPNPVFGSHDAFCEPFDVSLGAGGDVEVGPGSGLSTATTTHPPRRTRSWRRTFLTPRGSSQSSDMAGADAEAQAGRQPLYCLFGQCPEWVGQQGLGAVLCNKTALSGCGPCH